MEYKKNAEMSECKVSVIVPVYNVEAYLEECIDSLRGQTLEDIEILLIDDGSTDLSGAICDRYAKVYQNIYVIHKTNGGQGAARNLGLSKVKGKYVYYMDSDDLLEPDALNKLYYEAEKNNLDVILFSAECFSDSQEIDYNPTEYIRTKYLHEVKTGKDLFSNLYGVGEYYCSIPMRFFNRNYLMENKFVFPEHIIHEDEIFGFFSLIKAKRAACIPDQFYKRRYRKGSTMTGKKAYNSAIGYLYTWKVMMQFLLEEKSYTAKNYYEFAMLYFAMAVSLYNSFSEEEKKLFVLSCKEIKKFIQVKKIHIEFKYKLFIVSPFVYKQYKKLKKGTKIVKEFFK